MIYTVTFNPALDYVVDVKEFTSGITNRSSSETMYYGGKGINVSFVLKQLGYDSVAFGFEAGFTGKELIKGIEQMGITSDLIHLDEGMTRINVKIRSNDESEINCVGPNIPDNKIKELFNKLDQLQKDDILILSGSIPSSMSDSIYEDILSFLKDKGVLFVVDATKDLLLNVLKYKPFLIKPNNHELGEMFNTTLKTDDEIITYAKKLQEKGARNVLISMAGDGSILVDEIGGVYKAGVPAGKVKNSVGAGDSMVAGFVAGYLNNHDYKEALQLAGACGSATAYSESLASRKDIDRLLKEIQDKDI
ncbi:MAG: 1-phosphofructokinase [Thomasclavelia sp.]|nr:1-phosphofructokinase [Thomasclavelia sp.]